MDLKIKEVSALRELKAFIKFPFTLYRRHACYVPPLVFDELNTLRKDRNPAFEHCQARYWLAYRDGKIVGRIAAIINRLHIEKWGERYMRFGWVDFVDDPVVSAALFGAVEKWAAEEGLSAVHGPLGFTDMDPEGMLVEGFDEPGTMATIYNHPYYPVHLEQLGYIKDIDAVEYEVKVPTEPVEKIAKLADLVQRRYKLRIMDFGSKKEMLNYADALFELLDECYKPLYGVVPLTRKQVEAYIKQYFGFVSPDFVPVVVDENDRMVAFGIAMPSLTRALQRAGGSLFPLGFAYLLKALRWNNRGDLYLVAVHPEYQGRGVNALLINHMIGVFNRFGIRKVESNPELETNILVQGQWKHFEHRQHKRRRIFIKRLNGSEDTPSGTSALVDQKVP